MINLQAFTKSCYSACSRWARGSSALITLFILYDVIARNIGLAPFTHTLALTEYGLYYVTLLGAPWLVRKKHHVYMQLITAFVPAPVTTHYFQTELPALCDHLWTDLLLRRPGDN